MNAVETRMTDRCPAETAETVKTCLEFLLFCLDRTDMQSIALHIQRALDEAEAAAIAARRRLN